MLPIYCNQFFFAVSNVSTSTLVHLVGNCTLNPKEMEMLVVLRMNRRFMEYMRTRHKKMSIAAAKKLMQEMEADPVLAGSYQESEDDNVPWTLVKVLTKAT